MLGVTALVDGAGFRLGVAATVIHIVAGLSVYILYGKANITPLGIFALASIAFLACPFVFISMGAYEMNDAYNGTAIISALGFCIVSLIASTICPKRLWGGLAVARESITERMCNGMALWQYAAVILWIFGILVRGDAETLLSRFAEGAFFCSVLISSACCATAWKSGRLVAMAVSGVLTVLWMLSYYVLAFSGFGRLKLVAVGFAFLLPIALAGRAYILKIAPLLFAPVFLLWAGMYRSGMRSGEEVTVADVFGEGAGLGSLNGPFLLLTKVIEEFGGLVESGTIGFLHGHTYLYTVLFWVPSKYWADKPGGLGRLYVEWFYPEMLHTGHSLAGSYLGEGFVNFGISGLAVAPILTGFVLGLVMRFLLTGLKGRTSSDVVWLRLLLLFAISASLADFVWADSNTFMHRGMLRIVTVLICWVGVRIVRKIAGRAIGVIRSARLREVES